MGNSLRMFPPRQGIATSFYVVGKDGGSPRALHEANILDRLSWLKDGSAIVLDEMASPGEDFDIKTIALKTGQVHELQGSKTLAYPDVSPDGRYVATVTEDTKKLRIYDFSS